MSLLAARSCIHITGASGSGTSTLGCGLAARLSVPWFDTDSYYWLSTIPPFVTPRPMPERVERLARALEDEVGWVLSGSLCGWGDLLIPRFSAVIFLWLPQGLRLARLHAREKARYGARISPGGDMHKSSVEFLAWAARYDAGGMEQRSRMRHEAWLAALPCAVLRLESSAPASAVLSSALAGLQRGTA